MIQITYLIYIVFWESLIFGGGFYLVLERNWSPWWLVLSLILSLVAYSPSKWRQLVDDKKE